ncbi:MAG: histidinol-phosphatase HisJ [Nitrospirota bacterium]
MLLVDYHIHTYLCKHADGTIEEYIKRAGEIGLSEIGFSDHAPMPEWYDPEHRMKRGELPLYLKLIEKMRSVFPEQRIKIGIEVDYFNKTTDYVKEVIESYPFDYVIGSVHYIGGWGFDNPRNIKGFNQGDIFEIYKEYFSLVEDAANSRLFDIIGHPDLVKKFGYFPDRSYDELIKGVLKVMKDNDLCLEINTSGLRKPVKEIYPDRRFIEMAKDMEIPVTLGSDAHSPNDVGRDLDLAAEIIKKAGYQTIAAFKKRKREEINI